MLKIEGKNAVRETLLSHTKIEKILVTNSSKDPVLNEIIKIAKEKKIKIQFVPIERITKESKTGKHQGIIAFCEDYKYTEIEDIILQTKKKGENIFLVILDGIEDPHNFGSIIRVCECLGVSGIVIGKNRACPVNETVIKTSTGAINHIKIARVTNINQTIEQIKKQNIWVYACELGGSDLTKSDLSGDVAIVIGSEGFGISSLTQKLCDGKVTIPMKGKVNSLNASVATGIVVYEVSKQR